MNVQKLSLKGLQSIAVFEAIKGLFVLIAAFGLLTFIHKDIQALGEELLQFLHINPLAYYPHLFLEFLGNLKPSEFVWMMIAALCYSTLRFVEAYGLWKARRWAEWLAIISSGIYLPVEFYEVYRHITWFRVTLTAANLAILGYLLWIRFAKPIEPSDVL